MSDLIDRQGIIDALDHVINNGAKNKYIDGHIITAEAMKEYILAQPSAQPEIIRCKDCKYYKAKQGNLPWKNSRRYCNRSVTLVTNPYDFCSYAERRTDE